MTTRLMSLQYLNRYFNFLVNLQTIKLPTSRCRYPDHVIHFGCSGGENLARNTKDVILSLTNTEYTLCG